MQGVAWVEDQVGTGSRSLVKVVVGQRVENG